MRAVIPLALAAVAMVGCALDSHYARMAHWCEGIASPERVRFIAECVPDALDEESNSPALVRQCDRTSRKLFCPRTVIWGVQGDGSNQWPCSDARGEGARAACKRMGYVFENQ